MTEQPDVVPVRVLIADDHPVVRRGLGALVGTLPGMRVVGEAADGAAAVKEAQLLRPDVVIMDIAMPGVDGLEATRRIAAAAPEVAVVVLTMHDDEDTLLSALEAGACGYLLKGAEQSAIESAIRAAASGQLVFGADLVARLRARLVAPPTGPVLPELTAREREVLDLMAAGCSNAVIARRLQLARRQWATTRRPSSPNWPCPGEPRQSPSLAAAAWVLRRRSGGDEPVTGLALAWAAADLVPALCLLAGLVTVAVVAHCAHAPRPTVALTLTGALLLAVGVLGGTGLLPSALGDRAALGGLLVVLPLACLWVPAGPPRPVVVVAVPVVVLAGATAAVVGDPDWTNAAELVVALTVAAAVWYRFEGGEERPPGRARDRLRWLALGLTVTMLASIPVDFAGDRGAVHVLVVSALTLVVTVSVACAYVLPERVDARMVAGRVVGLLVSVVVAFAVWSGVVAALTVAGLDTTRPGVGGLVAVGVATGFGAERRLIDQTVDLLLFGERLDPVRAASRFAAELAAADDPVAVLRALREVLGLPSAAVRDETGQTLISSGEPGAGRRTSCP